MCSGFSIGVRRDYAQFQTGGRDLPTKAPETLFSPDFSKAQVKPLLDLAIPLLSEVLHYGLALFARCCVRPDGEDENLAVLFPYRHFLRCWIPRSLK